LFKREDCTCSGSRKPQWKKTQSQWMATEGRSRQDPHDQGATTLKAGGKLCVWSSKAWAATGLGFNTGQAYHCVLCICRAGLKLAERGGDVHAQIEGGAECFPAESRPRGRLGRDHDTRFRICSPTAPNPLPPTSYTCRTLTYNPLRAHHPTLPLGLFLPALRKLVLALSDQLPLP